MDKTTAGLHRDGIALHIAAEDLAKSGVCPGRAESCVDISLRACSNCVLQWLRNKAELELDLMTGAGGA